MCLLALLAKQPWRNLQLQAQQAQQEPQAQPGQQAQLAQQVQLEQRQLSMLAQPQLALPEPMRR